MMRPTTHRAAAATLGIRGPEPGVGRREQRREEGGHGDGDSDLGELSQHHRQHVPRDTDDEEPPGPLGRGAEPGDGAAGWASGWLVRSGTVVMGSPSWSLQRYGVPGPLSSRRSGLAAGVGGAGGLRGCGGVSRRLGAGAAWMLEFRSFLGLWRSW